MSLNPHQRAAIKEINHPLLVIAGAGSGKTRVITHKIAHLIDQGLAARHIAALTFTNKAAREMKARVGKLMDSKALRGLTVSTFHSLGLDILRREHKALGFKASLSIFDEQDRLALLKDILEHSKHPCNPDKLPHYAWQIGAWKNDCLPPEQILAQADAEQQPAACLYEEYNRCLKAYNAVDFDDLILLPVQLFQEHGEILERWQHKLRYLLVDEYQDTNQTQYRLLNLLTGPLGRFTVVGDDDQSIYAWRGARPENLQRLKQDYPRLKIIMLEQNYRSTGRILKAANALIRHNPHVFEKKLWSAYGFGDPIRVLSHADDLAEAQQIAADILHHHFQHRTQWHDYAILYRSNHQSRVFERALREQRIPYKVSGGPSFFSYTEVKDVLAYLRLFVNQDDDAAFLRIINVPKREIGPTTLEKLGAYAQQRHISLFSACFELGLEQHLPARATARLKGFCEWLVDTADRAQRGDTLGVLEEFIDRIEYKDHLQNLAASPKQFERKWQNVRELLDWLGRLIEEEEDAGGKDILSAVVAKIMLMDVLERQRDDSAQDQVTLMTLHAAKGLEFPHVYIVGMEEGLLPHHKSAEETTNDTSTPEDLYIEEERRLAYVGITRAQKTLTFSYCRQRKRYGEVNDCQPSRFLEELPEEDLEWPEKSTLSPEEKKARGKAALANLKNLLNET
ncbi:MAG: ATP-dependent DNA helicase Rep [Methylothermaceae bacteria B42]|nr:MAG: ATP-dependent DNA helicase Rep [Methylothermaceae bacteria B42]HHJ39411.1 DNA helicase Rep [Methylothermaceae bacterium]